jgi:hypothetical protein
MVLQMGLFLLPILVVFVPAIFRRRVSWLTYAVGAALVVAGLLLAHAGALSQWGAPYLGRSFWWPFGNAVSLLLTAAILFCLLALLNEWVTRPSLIVKSQVQKSQVQKSPVQEARLPLRSLLTLVLPLGLANAALLVLRAGFTAFWDRYTLPLLFIALILLMRFYQLQRRGNVPVVALLVALVYGVYGAGLVHDDFAERRAALAVANEVEARGIPRTQIKGDWDYDELTELMIAGHVYAPHMRLPKGAVIPPSTHYGIPDCVSFFCDFFPHVLPKYALVHAAGPGWEEFPPVSYRTWILPAGTIYVVHFP